MSHDQTPTWLGGMSEPVPVIDIGSAVDLLAAAVERRGEDFLHGPVWTEESRHLTRRYANRGTPGCIIGWALAFAGVGVHELEAMPDEGVRDLYLRGELPVRLTLGALAVFHAAQQSQDRGGRLGDVVVEATAAAVRFVDLVPDTLFDLATQSARARRRRRTGGVTVAEIWGGLLPVTAFVHASADWRTRAAADRLDQISSGVDTTPLGPNLTSVALLPSVTSLRRPRPGADVITPLLLRRLSCHV